MSFFTDHLLRIVDTYEGNPPLPAFLRSYFKKYPKLGSRDRRALSEAAFIYYRCRRFYSGSTPLVSVVRDGYALCNSSNVFLAKMLEIDPLAEKAGYLQPEIVSPVGPALSTGIASADWLQSMWQQPQLFIRIRKDRERILDLLAQEGVACEMPPMPGNTTQDCISLLNGTPVDKLLPEEAYVVQDWASQASMYTVMEIVGKPGQVWDVCSGAGGKSILLKDKLPPFQLTATDIRETILHNLKMRFRLYGLSRVKTMVMDSADSIAVQTRIGEEKFGLVLCDVPCSGSGTWARSPEQFSFFKDQDLKRFEALQYDIALNASRHVADGGFMAYVTCSVFRQENEDVAERLQKATGMECLHRQIINGLDQKADCMFVAVFRRNANG